ncbi:MAG: hypothetical protein CSB44_11965 [Gammaproteobacteria bacterium]|nr:MAG: hypothetical protein CSB44_11965 [Gammaproteobacteria bacterium]
MTARSILCTPRARIAAVLLFLGFGSPFSTAADASQDNQQDATAETSSAPEHAVPLPNNTAPRLRLIIDPGHGGSDPGSVAPNGLREKDLTLDIARRVMRYLSEVPEIEVHTTRISDTGMSRQKRVNRIRASQADLMLSLHFNHLPQHNVNLVETHYAARGNVARSHAHDHARAAARTAAANRNDTVNLDFTEHSAAFATMVQKNVHNEVKAEDSDATDAGTKANTLFVLTRSFTPGALVEIACISHPEEADRLVDVNYRNRLAAAIADAVRQYHREEFLPATRDKAI